MNRFNRYFANHFSGCQHLASTHDQNRNRNVKIYRVPGIADFVGITDGTDCWMAPVSHSLFRVDIKRLLDDMQAGHKRLLPIVSYPDQAPLKKARRQLDLETGTQPMNAATGEPRRRSNYAVPPSRRATLS